MKATDICIIGAGPGGVATAMFLAKKGIPSTLIDRAKFPRDKICGDALSGKVIEVIRKLDPSIIDRMELDQNHQLGSYGVTFVAPNLKSLDIPFKTNYKVGETQAPGFISKRIDFDHFWLQEALKMPEINFVDETEIRDFQKIDGGYRITDKSGKFSADCKMVIAADGANSKFARQEGGLEMEHKHYCAGLRAYYKGVKDLHKENFIELQFLKDFLPGYFWIFPLPNGMANVGVGMRSDKVSKKKINLKKRMLEIIHEVPVLKERFADAELIGDIKGYGLPLGSKKREISGEHYLLVGDAGSLIDPFTGEGIGNALFSGMYAAEQVERCLAQGQWDATFNKQYDQATYGRLWDELKLSARMQYLVRYPWLFNLVVNRAEKNKVLRETISCMFEDLDLRDRLRKPSFYFKLLFSGN